MKYTAGILFAIIAVLPFGAMLLRETPSVPAATDAEEVLLIVSPHRREVRLEYSRAFSRFMLDKHGRSVAIRWVDAGGTSNIVKDLESRFSNTPGSAGIDLMFGGGIEPYINGAARGWFIPADISDGILEPIPALCAGFPVYDPQKRWFGIAVSGFGIIYNRPLLELLKVPEPTTWEDLTTPQYFTWVGSGDPRSSGSVHMCYEIILQACGFEKGWELITKLCANVRRFGEGGGAAPRETAMAEVAAGMVIDQYAQTAIAAVGDNRLGFVLPDGLTIVNPDAIGLLKGAPNKELAVVFIEFALSEEGQKILFQPSGIDGQRHTLHRMPVLPTCYQMPNAPASNPYNYKKGFTYNTALGGKRWQVVNKLIGKRLIDPHDKLTEAWEAVIQAGCPKKLLEELCKAPLEEEELTTITEEWKNIDKQLELSRQWGEDASERYERIIKKAKLRAKLH